MSANSVPAVLERAAVALPADASGLRRDAFERFRDHGFPTRKDERWRYTDLRAIAAADLDFSVSAPAPAAIAAAAHVIDSLPLNPNAARCVVLDGHFVQVLSTTTERVVVDYIAECAVTAASPANENADTRHWLAELSTAFAPGRLLISADAADSNAAADAADTPRLELIVLTGRSQSAVHCQVAIDLPERATLAVTQFIGHLPGVENVWLNQAIEVRQAAGTKLTFTRLQQARAALDQTTLFKARLGRDASLECGTMELGGRLTRNDFDILLGETGANATLFGLAFARNSQHVDNQIAIDHRAPQTTSRQDFRNIVGDESRGVFNGKVIVRPGAQRIDASQSSDNLLLSDRAEIDTKPELEIYADDVKCSHGATIGEIDETQLFYLRSRGIDEQTARSLLTFAFANVIVERITDPLLREHVAEYFTTQLPDDLRTELS